jgi:hypothetical protein
MINVTYGITEEIYSLGNTSRTSYGIAAYADTNMDHTATIVVAIHDITPDRHAIAELVSLCNCLELSTLHLLDVVEDFIFS